MNSRSLSDGWVWYNHYDRDECKFMRYPYCLESHHIDWNRGEEFTPPKLTAKLPRTAKRTNRKRGAEIEMIAQDVRITSRARHTQATLIDEVMEKYSVSRNNARKLICLARKLNRHAV